MKLRHELLRRQYVGASIWHVYTAADAIEALKVAVPFDVATLDHDLEGIKRSTFEKTGQQVCRYIAAMAPKQRPGKIIIHSWNNEGSARMALILRAAGIPSERAAAPCSGVPDDDVDNEPPF